MSKHLVLQCKTQFNWEKKVFTDVFVTYELMEALFTPMSLPVFTFTLILA